MAKEFSVMLEDEPGSLARLTGVLGEAGVNIEALAGSSREAISRVQFLCSAPDRAAESLQESGIPYVTREVLVVRVLDKPGMLGDVALVMSSAGINIDSVYLTTHGHVVLGVDDLAGAIQVAGGMAVTIPE